MTHSTATRRTSRITQTLSCLAIMATLLFALAVPAAAHPQGHGTGQTALPPSTPNEPTGDGDGGTSPVVVGGVAIGLIALAGGLIYARERERRSGTATAAAAKPKSTRITSEEKRRARSSW